MENKNKFLNKLIKKKFPNQNTKALELWDVEGILHNQNFKFDLRPIKNNSKTGSFHTKADKMVFDIKDQYIIVDIEELHQYLKENNIKDVKLEDLIFKLEWNIILSK